MMDTSEVSKRFPNPWREILKPHPGPWEYVFRVACRQSHPVLHSSSGGSGSRSSSSSSPSTTTTTTATQPPTAAWRILWVGGEGNTIIKHIPWESKTKQRTVFRMIHVKESVLPCAEFGRLGLPGYIYMFYIFLLFFTTMQNDIIYQ